MDKRELLSGQALLDRLEELERLAYAGGQFICASCGLRISSACLTSFGQRWSDAPQTCPNGHGLMRRATEREIKDLAIARLEGFFERTRNAEMQAVELAKAMLATLPILDLARRTATRSQDIIEASGAFETVARQARQFQQYLNALPSGDSGHGKLSL